MRLRNPGASAIDAAAETLRQLKFGCENCRSTITFDEGKNAYLNWVEQAYAQLRSLFVDASLADGLHSRFFWEIRRMDSTSPRPFELLSREVQTQSDRLQAICDRLLGYKEFASRAGHIAIPDTSALVEGVWFEDFDWPAALGLTSTVRIVVPILVVEELDKLKDRERTSKAGDRARRVLRRLRALCGAVPPGHPAQLPTRTVMGYRVRRSRPVGWSAISAARCSSRWGSPPTPCSTSSRSPSYSPTAAWYPAPVASITTVATPSMTSATVTR